MVNVAVVTGANKGIGYGIVENFVKNLPSQSWVIYLTSRNTELGQASFTKLQNAGASNLKYHQLDITVPESRKNFIQFLKNSHPEGVKVWINNAAIAFKNDAPNPMGEQAEVTTK
ncbi:Carbonyl reductase [NADPH] 3 [Cichlidogyrus casuarinus]|uniref:Carbonyl reductase [NADPH] 3 n=1 Tax=Cichlidogyrus casuarinus TaxID=1844966 RepID=A0ABD2Q1R6_9PLAT